MPELTVFFMAYIGAVTGVMTAILPVIYLFKKKWEESSIANMFGG